MRRAHATHSRAGSCSNEDRSREFAAQASGFRALRRRHGRDGVRDRDVVRRDRLAGLLDPPRPARPRDRRASRCSCRCRCSRCPPAICADRYPASHRARARDRASTRSSPSGCSLVTRAGASETWPFFALAFGTGVASGARRAGRPRADAVARPAGDPRQGVRAAVDRVPAVGDRRPGARRAALRDPARARVRRRRRRSRSSRSLARARDACGPRRRRSRLARPRERPRRGSPRPPHARPARRDLPRPVRRPVRRRRRAAARVREGRARGRAGRARRPPRGARGRGARARRWCSPGVRSAAAPAGRC